MKDRVVQTICYVWQSYIALVKYIDRNNEYEYIISMELSLNALTYYFQMLRANVLRHQDLDMNYWTHKSAKTCEHVHSNQSSYETELIAISRPSIWAHSMLCAIWISTFALTVTATVKNSICTIHYNNHIHVQRLRFGKVLNIIVVFTSQYGKKGNSSAKMCHRRNIVWWTGFNLSWIYFHK